MEVERKRSECECKEEKGRNVRGVGVGGEKVRR